jgi:[acyl-carrier-protein] S-malonyltransferase
MGRAWCEASGAAREVFEQADEIMGDGLGAPLSELCFRGPAERLNATDAAQPALYTCSIASLRGLAERNGEMVPAAAAGLSLGEYTALHLAGAFAFADGLRLVARRGRLMQDAADEGGSGMVAIIGADEPQARALCEEAAGGDVLVCANFNAPGQIVLSGTDAACARAVEAAGRAGFKATPLPVAGAFHSPLMEPASRGMAEALDAVDLAPLHFEVWSNVTGRPHDRRDTELLRRLLVEQITSAVRWSDICQGIGGGGTMEYHELAPGSVLRGLMRRIDRQKKVISHDEPQA